jgi:hypothetical protein
MSYRELIEWEAFVEEFGPVTLHERLDSGFALLMQQQAAYHGDQRSVEEFLPRWEREGKAHIADWLSAMAKRT